MTQDINWQRCFGFFILFSSTGHWVSPVVFCVCKNIPSRRKQQPVSSMMELKLRELHQLAFTTSC